MIIMTGAKQVLHLVRIKILIHRNRKDILYRSFVKCYFAGVVFDLNGDTVRLDTGQVLEYLPWKVDVDISGKPFEKVAGARMKKYAIDKTATKDGKLMDNDIVLFRYADVLL